MGDFHFSSKTVLYSLYIPYKSCVLLGNIFPPQKGATLIFSIYATWELCTFREHISTTKRCNLDIQYIYPMRIVYFKGTYFHQKKVQLRHSLYIPHVSCVLLGNRFPPQKGATWIFTIYIPWEVCTYREHVSTTKRCNFDIQYICYMRVVYF